MFAEIIEQIPLLPVTGASIRAALQVCEKVAASLRGVPPDDPQLRQIMRDSYRSRLVGHTELRKMKRI
jgi:predicted Rdx family selenoprotein